MRGTTTRGRRRAAGVAALCVLVPLAGCSAGERAEPESGQAPPEPSATPQTDDPRPNLVMVLVDDLGWGDLGSGRFDEGNPNRFVDTPSMDRLAAQGTAFPNGYGALSCAPSRMGLLTGQYPQRPDNGLYGGLDPDTVAPPYDGPPLRLSGVENRSRSGGSRLAADTDTVPERLAAAGYWNAHVGKFDVTGGAQQITERHGYDVNYGGGPAGSPATYTARPGESGGWSWGGRVDGSLDDFAEPYTPAYVEQVVLPQSDGVSEAEALDLVGEPKNLTDAVGDAAVLSVDQGAETGGPFLVSVNHFAVHSPVDPTQARPDLLAKYRERSRPGDGRVPSYAAMVEGVDQTVGRLLDHLEGTPDPRAPGRTLAENTVVVLMSDNGGRVRFNGLSDRRIGGDNGPLRGEKMQLWEGGIRVPLAVWSGDPRLVRRGAVNRSIVHVTDVAATFADLARVPAGARRDLDGRSVRPALVRGAEVSGPLLQHFPAYSLGKGRDQRPATVMRSGRWKVRYDYESRRLRLYDLTAELSESTDVAAARPATARRLGVAMATELARLDTPLATLRARYGPVLVRVRAGTVTYADGTLTRHRRPDVLRVAAGDEVPVVVGPGRRG